MTASTRTKKSLAVGLVLCAAAVGGSSACGHDTPEDAPPKLSEAALRDPQSCATCHPDHVRQWSGSMHAYAGQDPVFLALNRRGQRETQGKLGSFCVNCHAPLAVRAGATSDGLNLDQVDPTLRGVNCYFCHASEFDGGDLHDNPLVLTGDHVMRGGFKDPVPNTAHEAVYSTSHDHLNDKSALFCGSCHDIVNPQGAHVERTFAEWRSSHFATEGRQVCGSCHMAESTGLAAQAPGVLVRKVHDHTMTGVDLALTPFPELDPQRAGVQKILDDALSARLCVRPDPGGGASVEVTLINEKVGHFFPSGANQDRRAWVELEGSLGGTAIFSSGKIPDGTAATAFDDPQLFLLRDRGYDASGNETHIFSETVRVDPFQIPVAPSSRSAESERSRAKTYTFPGAMPDRVTMQVKIRPIDVDLLDDLVASGDLATGFAERIPTFTLARTVLTWMSGAADCVATTPP